MLYSAVDPDHHGSAFIWLAGSGSRRAKRNHKKYKIPGSEIIISCFEVLGVFFWGLEASPEAWMSFVDALE